MVKILLVEDHSIVRNGIRMLLETDKDISVIGEATNGHEALAAVLLNPAVDIVLSDIDMPEMDGLTLLAKIQEINPNMKLMMLSMLDDDKYISQSFKHGASGYLLKKISADELIFSVKHVHNGNKYLCSELANKLLDRLLDFSSTARRRSELHGSYSKREIDVLKLIAEGLTNIEISEQLMISRRTIEGHRQSLIEKTGSKNTASLIKFALLRGLI